MAPCSTSAGRVRHKSQLHNQSKARAPYVMQTRFTLNGQKHRSEATSISEAEYIYEAADTI